MEIDKIYPEVLELELKPSATKQQNSFHDFFTANHRYCTIYILGELLQQIIFVNDFEINIVHFSMLGKGCNATKI